MCRMLRVLLIGCATLMLLGTTLALAGSTRDDTLGLRVREDTQEASSVLERGVQSLGGCLVYPANNVWNTPVDTLPVHTHSADFINLEFRAPAEQEFCFEQTLGVTNWTMQDELHVAAWQFRHVQTIG